MGAYGRGLYGRGLYGIGENVVVVELDDWLVVDVDERPVPVLITTGLNLEGTVTEGNLSPSATVEISDPPIGRVSVGNPIARVREWPS